MEDQPYLRRSLPSTVHQLQALKDFVQKERVAWRKARTVRIRAFVSKDSLRTQELIAKRSALIAASVPINAGPIEKTVRIVARAREQREKPTCSFVAGMNTKFDIPMTPMPSVRPVPKYCSWVPIKTSHRVADEPVLTHIPYFGDGNDIAIDTSLYEGILPQGDVCTDETHEAEHLLELLINKFGSDPESLMQYGEVLGYSDAELSTIHAHIVNKRVGVVSSAAYDDTVYNSKRPLSAENILDSFRDIFCRRCYTYDCNLHGCNRMDYMPQEPEVRAHPLPSCGPDCYFNDKAGVVEREVPTTTTTMTITSTTKNTNSSAATTTTTITTTTAAAATNGAVNAQGRSSGVGGSSPSMKRKRSSPASEVRGATGLPPVVRRGGRGKGGGEGGEKAAAAAAVVEEEEEEEDDDDDDGDETQGHHSSNKRAKIGGGSRGGGGGGGQGSKRGRREGQGQGEGEGRSAAPSSDDEEGEDDEWSEDSDTQNRPFASERSRLLRRKMLVRASEAVEGWSFFERAVHLRGRQVFGDFDYCRIAQLIHTKSCKEVAAYTLKVLGAYSTLVADEAPLLPVRKRKKRKGVLGKFKGGAKAKRVEKDLYEEYVPCCHEGPCTVENNCLCAESGNNCEKFCACTGCANRFPGCSCARSNCRTRSCPCFASSRECDPDLCRACDAGKEAPPRQCCNVALQTRQTHPLLVAVSDVAGWGVFVKNDAEKGDLVAEYIGELVSQAEAERRGKIYDKQMCSFLFNLNEDCVIDAARKGNKIKFANHSINPNLSAKIMLVNGDYRIALYANNAIPAGTELFFDYRYGPELEKFVPWEREFHPH